MGNELAYLLLFCSWVLAGAVIILSVQRRSVSTYVGAAFATVYFVLIPMTWLVVIGRVELLDIPSKVPYALVTFDETWMPHVTRLLVHVTTFLVGLAVLEVLRAKRPSLHPTALIGNVVVYQHLALAIVAIFLLTLTVEVTLAGKHWYAGRGEFFEKWGFVGVFGQHALFIFRVIFMVAVTVRVLRGQLTPAVGVAVVLFVAVLDLYVTGNRIFTLQIMVLLLFLMLLQRKYRYLFGLVVVAIPLGLAMTLYKYYRSLRTIGGDLAAIDESLGLVSSLTTGMGDVIAIAVTSIFEMVNINVALSVFSGFADHGILSDHLTFLKIFQAPVPRSMLPDKLESITIIIAGLLVPGANTSLVPLAFGEAFVNVRDLAPVVLIALLFLVHATLSLFRTNGLRDLLGLVIGFSFVRFPFSDLYVSVLIGAGLVWGFGQVLKASHGPNGTVSYKRSSEPNSL